MDKYLISSLIHFYTISSIDLILGVLYDCKIQDKMCQIKHCVLLWDWLNGPPIWGRTKPGGEAFLSTKLRPQQQSRKIGTPTSFLLSLFNCPILADRFQDSSQLLRILGKPTHKKVEIFYGAYHIFLVL